MKKKSFKKIIFVLGAGTAALFFVCAVFGLAVFAYFSKDLPDPSKFTKRQVAESTKIYDSTGKVLLYEIHGEEKRTVVPFSEIPDAVKKATVAVEDSQFYEHPGLRLRSILRAVWEDLKNLRFSQGGSTITQQLIKNSILTRERTLSRKIKEIILSVQFERKYSKNQILEFYLNQIPYGSNAYGIEAAAQTFFNKPAKNLTLAEAAALAALPKAPSYYSPYGEHFDELKARQEFVLEKMAELNFASRQEVEKAKREKLNLVMKDAQNIKAPHFVMFVRDYLNEKYGEDFVERGGLKVYTTLDWRLQEEAEKIISEGATENAKKYKAENAALVALEPKTGKILAMVGSADYFNIEKEGNVNVVTRLRMPGSSFKPFAYAAALKKGFTPETVVFDVPTEFSPNAEQCPAEPNFSNDNKVCYHPQNYDGKFRGPVSLRSALAQSLNIPSVKTLYLAGINETISLAESMGITTLKDRSAYGLSLVLGAGDVKLLELASAYGVFATEGVKTPSTAILKIEKTNGEILEEYAPQKTKVLDEQTARQITDILSDNEARAPMFGQSNPLYLGERPIAAKTGTTQNYQDAWVLGYTPSLSVGVWVGNNHNQPMDRGGAGISAAGPLWNKFVRFALEGTPIEVFNKPDLIQAAKPILNSQWLPSKKLKIDKVSGKIATELTPPEFIEEKEYGALPHSLLYYVDKNNPQGDPLPSPGQDPQFYNWEAAVQKWASDHKRAEEGYKFTETAPSEYDDVHTIENKPTTSIDKPRMGEFFQATKPMTVEVSAASAKFKIKEVDFFFKDELVGMDTSYPYQVSFAPDQNDVGTNELKVKVYDDVGNQNEQIIKINVY